MPASTVVHASASTWPTGYRLGLAGPVTIDDLARWVDLGTFKGKSAGASLMTTLIAEMLRRGITLSVFTCDENVDGTGPAGPFRRFDGPQMRLYAAPRRRRAFGFERGRPGRIVDLFALERAGLRAAMAADDCEVIHAHWSYEYAAAALDVRRPLLLTCHDSPAAIFRTMPDLYRAGRWWMAHRVFKRAGCATVVSPYLAAELTGSLRSRPKVVANPIPDLAFALGRDRARPADHPVVGMVLNGWSPRKNAAPALRALAQLCALHHGLRVELIGPGFGPAEEAARWLAAEGLVLPVQLLGARPHTETLQRMAEWDLLLHPSLEESFGLTVAEAMASGLPIVAGQHSGAVPWVTGGVAGALVDVRQPELIARAVASLLQDPAAYAAASRSGRARAEATFSARAVVDEYLGLCNALRTADPQLATVPGAVK